MAPKKGEEIVIETWGGPRYGAVAFLAVVDPAVSDVIRGGLKSVGLVATLALNGRTSKVSDGGLIVATFAGRNGVGGDQWKAGPCVLDDETGWSPVVLVVAAGALRPKVSLMRVDVATSATPNDVDFHRSSIVVTPQARGLGMRPFQSETGFLFVIEFKVFSQLVPSLRYVADVTVCWKRFMGNHGAPFLAPTLARN